MCRGEEAGPGRWSARQGLRAPRWQRAARPFLDQLRPRAACPSPASRPAWAAKGGSRCRGGRLWGAPAPRCGPSCTPCVDGPSAGAWTRVRRARSGGGRVRARIQTQTTRPRSLGCQRLQLRQGDAIPALRSRRGPLGLGLEVSLHKSRPFRLAALGSNSHFLPETRS